MGMERQVGHGISPSKVQYPEFHQLTIPSPQPKTHSGIPSICVEFQPETPNTKDGNDPMLDMFPTTTKHQQPIINA